jgi:hypothetical protein
MDHLHTIALALPTLAALERLQPADTLAPVRDVVVRMGAGALRSVATRRSGRRMQDPAPPAGELALRLRPLGGWSSALFIAWGSAPGKQAD